MFIIIFIAIFLQPLYRRAITATGKRSQVSLKCPFINSSFQIFQEGKSYTSHEEDSKLQIKASKSTVKKLGKIIELFMKIRYFIPLFSTQVLIRNIHYIFIFQETCLLLRNSKKIVSWKERNVIPCTRADGSTLCRTWNTRWKIWDIDPVAKLATTILQLMEALP